MFDHLETTAGCFVVADEMEAVEPGTSGVLAESAAQGEPQAELRLQAQLQA